jgi:hypothetical protein
MLPERRAQWVFVQCRELGDKLGKSCHCEWLFAGQAPVYGCGEKLLSVRSACLGDPAPRWRVEPMKESADREPRRRIRAHRATHHAGQVPGESKRQERDMITFARDQLVVTWNGITTETSGWSRTVAW